VTVLDVRDFTRKPATVWELANTLETLLMTPTTTCHASRHRPSPEWVIGSDSTSPCRVLLYHNALTDNESSTFFQLLHEGIQWQRRTIRLFGKEVMQPRLIAWHGDPQAVYRYSGDTWHPEPWIPELVTLRQRCEQLANTAFNSVLLNLYRDGNDAMGWHADDEPELGHEPVIASLNLGCMRRFDLRHRQSGETHQVWLPAGSLLVMAGATQQWWRHQLPRSKKITEPRLNLTFRRIITC
jgi:alkylated DNA repair dioxygenase AlkB